MNFVSGTLLSFLHEDLGDYVLSDVLTSDMSVSDARASALANSLFKKLVTSDAQKHRDDAAVALFLECNRRCASFEFGSFPMSDLILNQARELLYYSVHSGIAQSPDLSWADIVCSGLPGPGASVGRSADDSFFMKMFDSDLATTDASLYDYYKTTISGRWTAAEETRRSKHGLLVVEGSVTSCVPKNNTISRTICKEPILNMFLQKGLGHQIERWLQRDHAISLSTQPDVNAQMAQQGSINGTYGTIDLSSASDTIALSLCRSLLPASLMTYLERCRSPFTDVAGERVELHMISSMGNGFTFPLQTLIFASLVKAVYLTMGLPLTVRGRPHYSVFGDDIIVCREAYYVVCQTLEACGFTVNRLKSYNTGAFRESCGHDFYHGHNIRGVYLKRLDTPADFYSAINRLINWSARSGIYLVRSVKYLLEQVDFLPVPLHESDAVGIKVTQSKLKSPKLDRNGSLFYKALIKTAEQKVLGGSYVTHDGAIIAFVGGYIRGNSYAVRNGRACFKVVKLRTPCWDYGLGAEVDPREYSNVLDAMI